MNIRMRKCWSDTLRHDAWLVFGHIIDSPLSPGLICDPRLLVNTIMFPEVPTTAHINSFISQNSSSLFDTQHQIAVGPGISIVSLQTVADNACNVSLDNDLEKWPIMD